jgi:outer membrane immunogenic protein
MKLALVTAAAASVLAIAAIPAVASAQQPQQWNGYYGTLGYSGTDVVDGGPDLGSITGRFGWKSHSFWGLEAEGSVGVQHDTVGATQYNMNDQFAGYATATLPLYNHFDVFARVGYGQTRINSTPKGSGGTDNSFNYGGGAEWFWDNKNGLRGDYTRENFQQGGGDANVWTASYVRRF